MGSGPSSSKEIDEQRRIDIANGNYDPDKVNRYEEPKLAEYQDISNNWGREYDHITGNYWREFSTGRVICIRDGTHPNERRPVKKEYVDEKDVY